MLPNFVRQCRQQGTAYVFVSADKVLSATAVCPYAGYMSVYNGHRRTLLVVLKTHGTTYILLLPKTRQARHQQQAKWNATNFLSEQLP